MGTNAGLVLILKGPAPDPVQSAAGLRLHREPPAEAESIAPREAFLQTTRFTKRIDNIWVLSMHRELVLSP